MKYSAPTEPILLNSISYDQTFYLSEVIKAIFENITQSLRNGRRKSEKVTNLKIGKNVNFKWL